MPTRRTVTSYSIEIRTRELLKLLNERGYTTRAPNSDDPNYTITGPDDQAVVIPHRGAGKTAFEHILTAMQHGFGWNTVDVYKARMAAMFARNRERRQALQEGVDGWHDHRETELEAHSEQLLAANEMNLPVEMVTPDAAHQILLEHNLAARARGIGPGDDVSLTMLAGQQFVRQRRVSDARVDDIARDILQGRWELHHQGIALAKDNYLLDGQKRMWAFIRAGIKCPIVVARNVPDRGFHAMDNTEARNGAHVLDMLGVPNPTRANGALRLLHFYDNFPQDRTRWYSYKLSNAQIHADVLNHYLDIKESVEIGYRTSCSPETDLTPAALIAAHYVIQRACKDTWPEAPIAEFFESIAAHEPHEYFHAMYPRVVTKQFPARQLNSWSRTWETRAVAKKRGKNDKTVQFFCMILAAWGDSVQGEKWARPQFHERSDTPVPYVGAR